MKKVILGSVILTALFGFTSCGISFKDLAFPETITVKTNAKYEFTIGEKEFDLNEAFSLSSITNSPEDGSEEENSADSKIKIFSYNPENKSDIQQFLLQMDVQEIPLDFSSYLNQTNFTSSIGSMNIKKEFTIPEVNIEEEKVVDVEINNKINALVTFFGITTNRTDLAFVFDNAYNGFESISYKSGHMIITGAPDVSDTGFTYPIPEGEKLSGTVKLLYNDNVITQADFNSEGIALLPISNVTIKREGMALVFEGDTLGKTFYATVSSDSVVKEAKGLSLIEPVTTELETSISIGNDSPLQACDIGEGNLVLKLNIPVEWEGMNVNYSIDLEGGLEVSATQSDTVIDLAGKSFKNQDIKAKAQIEITMNNATIAFIDAANEPLNPSVTIKAQINKIDSAVVKLDADFAAKIDNKQALPEEALNVLDNIVWNPSGIVIEYTNTLPAGNDITIKMASDFFGMIEHEEAITNTASDEKLKIEFLCPADRDIKIGKGAGEYSDIDISAELGFTGFNSTEKTLTVNNVVPGDTYSIDFTITPIIDWKSITLDSSLSSQGGKISTGFNLSSVFSGMEEQIGSDLISKIKFKEIPLYLFCNVPALDNFDDPKFVGKVKAYPGDADCNIVENAEITYLLGSEEENGELKNASIPELSKNEAGEVINNLVTELSGCTRADLSTLLSDTSTDGALCIEYDVSFETGSGNGITITSEAVENLIEAGSTTIKLSAMVIIPLEVSVTDNIKMDLTELIGKTGSDEENPEGEEKNPDILGRTEAPTESDAEKYVDLIQKASIIYKSSKLPFKFVSQDNKDIALLIDLDGENEPEKDFYTEQRLNLSGDSIVIGNPSKLMSIYPLTPSLKLEVPAGTLSIPKDISFAAKLNLAIETNGTIEVWNKNEVKEGGK